MLQLQDITLIHPNKDVLFTNLSLSIHPFDKIALIGNNGVGKSSLLKIIVGDLIPNTGKIIGSPTIHYVPQLFDRYELQNIGQVTGIDKKLHALERISQGSILEEDYQTLEDDWLIEDRLYQALEKWGLQNVNPSTLIKDLSGGQKTKLFLSAIDIHNPDLIVLDEPTNHLDYKSKIQLYNFIRKSSKAILLVSHDRELLNLLDTTVEMTAKGLTSYGGNYDFYLTQKDVETQALAHELQTTEKDLRKAKLKERESTERQHKLDARGQKKQEKAGVARIMMNTLKNKAENSSSKLKNKHQEKTTSLVANLKNLQSEIPDNDKIKFDFADSHLHKGKILVDLDRINIAFNNSYLWKNDLSLTIRSGDRIAIEGDNATGKTTLIKIILGHIVPPKGNIKSTIQFNTFVDQEYKILQPQLSISEYVQLFNHNQLSIAEINTRLKRFLFDPNTWDTKIENLSGGERLRLILCTLIIMENTSDILILDEPTNNLDLKNIAILTKAIQSYKGTLLVVSHDKVFLNDIDIQHTININY